MKKPSIVYWAYIVLVCLLLFSINSLLSIIEHLDEDVGDIIVPVPLFMELLQVGVIIFYISVNILSAVSVYGLVKKYSWARIVTCSAVVIPALMALLMLSSNIYSAITYSLEAVLGDRPYEQVGFMIGLTVIEFSLLFFVYKVYTSKPLKVYLSRFPHATT